MSKVLGYKVRHTKTNLYLSSLSRSKWTKVGKTWPRKGDVVRAINNGIKYLRETSWKKGVYQNTIDDIPLWEIVELTEESTYPALFLLDKIKA